MFLRLAIFAAAIAALAPPPAIAEDDNTLYVHIIPHSHCDPGWLDTFEQYYRRDVNRILTGVMTELSRDPSKRFVWSELSFFMRWWQTLNSVEKQKFKRIVENGQLEFVGGGWVQNDEANPTAEAVVNQVSEGHDYIESLFGVRPHIGWQIDPFGHSALTPSLWALMGYDAMVINRIHYLTKKRLKRQAGMEFVWQGSRMSRQADLDTSIFTHVLHSHYSAPRGYDWEEPGVARVSQWNAGSRAASLVSKLKSRAHAYKTNHLLVTFGDDFKFKNAGLQFRNMDLIIKSINDNHGFGMHIRYSTLSEYFSAVHSDAHRKSVAFPFHRGDFFPYADNGDSYWTGYYSTRPNLKVSVFTCTSKKKISQNLLLCLHACFFSEMAIFFTRILYPSLSCYGYIDHTYSSPVISLEAAGLHFVPVFQNNFHLFDLLIKITSAKLPLLG